MKKKYFQYFQQLASTQRYEFSEYTFYINFGSPENLELVNQKRLLLDGYVYIRLNVRTVL